MADGDNNDDSNEMPRYMNPQQEAEFVRKVHQARAQGAIYAANREKKLKAGQVIIGEKGVREVETDAEIERRRRQQCINIIGFHNNQDQFIQKRAQKRVSKESMVIVDGEGLEKLVTQPKECKKKSELVTQPKECKKKRKG